MGELAEEEGKDSTRLYRTGPGPWRWGYLWLSGAGYAGVRMWCACAGSLSRETRRLLASGPSPVPSSVPWRCNVLSGCLYHLSVLVLRGTALYEVPITASITASTSVQNKTKVPTLAGSRNPPHHPPFDF